MLVAEMVAVHDGIERVRKQASKEIMTKHGAQIVIFAVNSRDKCIHLVNVERKTNGEHASCRSDDALTVAKRRETALSRPNHSIMQC